ncbi:MAG: hypothetical protein KDA89_02695, partial [Planctomycetaceae bacterium]|nr:hypothetical protein [Planctomycetaceae bacterium]
NKMPRWLSEGISVYEERQKDARWGQHMSPESRDRILAGNITPVSLLSSAFLTAKSGEDLNFAYYESSMVVEYLVSEYGPEVLKSVLQDLHDGLLINDTLDRHTGGLEQLDADFETWLTTAAEQFAPGIVFEQPKLPDGTPKPPELPDAANPDPQNYPAGLTAAAALLRAEQLDAAKKRLEELVRLFPEDSGRNSARRLLAVVYRRGKDAAAEAQVLAEHLRRSSDDLDAALRLLTLQVESESWSEALQTGELVSAIDPLRPDALRLILQAATAEKDDATAIHCLNGLLELDPADTARTRFLLAERLKQSDLSAARRHVLLSLEQAPRYREAHKLLLELGATPGVSKTRN